MLPAMGGADVSTHGFATARLELARLRADGKDALQRTLERATELSARTLGVERVGVWMFEEAGAVLRCKCLYEASRHRHSSGEMLTSADYPAYFRSVEELRTIVAPDALRDPLTRDLAETYLAPLGITSMLDAPLYRGGLVVGIVCHEHIGPMRTWSGDDQAFAASVADMVALIYEQVGRITAELSAQELEIELREARRLEELGRLAGRIAHDFNNVLTVMRAFAEAAMVHVGEPEVQREDLRNLEQSIQQAREHTRQLLAFARKQELELAEVDLSAMVRRAEYLITGLCRDRCELRFDLEAAVTTRADAAQLERVLLNLVINARDAMPKGGELRVTTRRARPTDAELSSAGLDPTIPELWACLEVRDEGIGMDPVTLGQIFEPYFSTKSASAGTGLGLATAYGTVRQCGGFVEVESTPGRGSVFRVWLPLLGHAHASS